MVKRETTTKDVGFREIKPLLQTIVVFQAARAGLSKEQARQAAKMDSTSVFKTWKNIKKTDSQ